MRIIKAKDTDGKRFDLSAVKTFFKKHGKKAAAAAAGVLIIGTAVILNFTLPKRDTVKEQQPADKSYVSGDFFAESALNRTKARDEAVEVLHTVVNSSGDENASKQALADISRISADIEKEANIETLIKAKGFEDCIAVISGKTLSIVVKSNDQLLPNEIAQIKEIAFKTADVLPDDVVISLKKQP